MVPGRVCWSERLMIVPGVLCLLTFPRPWTAFRERARLCVRSLSVIRVGTWEGVVPGMPARRLNWWTDALRVALSLQCGLWLLVRVPLLMTRSLRRWIPRGLVRCTGRILLRVAWMICPLIPRLTAVRSMSRQTA